MWVKYTSHMDSYGICQTVFEGPKNALPFSGLASALLRLRFGDLRSVELFWIPGKRKKRAPNATNYIRNLSKMIGSAARPVLWEIKVSIHKVCTESEFITQSPINICWANQQKHLPFFNQSNLHVNNKNPPHWPRKGSEAPQLRWKLRKTRFRL